MYKNSGILKTAKLFFERKQLCLSIANRPTIYALSSGNTRCAVAVVRISGSNSKDVCHKIAGISEPKPRVATLRKLRDPITNELLDNGIVIWFPGPRSFTGEDSCELQIHGGSAVIRAILNALGKLKGLRPAEPGEFTKRAFIAGKMDLTEVEGLSDLIHAETEAQRRQAMHQAEGSLALLYASWRNKLLKSVADIEAYIDFSEEENIEDTVLSSSKENVQNLYFEVLSHLNDDHKGEILRDGVHTAIVGAPNAGKSSLLNILCKRPAAIVSPIAGTTRDTVEVHVDIGGYPVNLSDTAGLRQTKDPIEAEGVSRAKSRANKADLLLIIVDTEELSKKYNYDIIKHVNTLNIQINDSEEDDSDNLISRNSIVILNKFDLLEKPSLAVTHFESYKNVVPFSCKTEDGFLQLTTVLTQKLRDICGDPGVTSSPVLTKSRHRYYIEKCSHSLEDFLSCENDTVLAAQHLRNALKHLGYITGHVSTEHILDVIFKDFCIGK